MIPRVFVSSTYYDLKHVRERLEKFIDSYGFEPVLFESDKVIYEHGQEIDRSAYREVELCHVMVLIIGGRYGSISSNDNPEEYRKSYNEGFVSITRKEFETAQSKNIPVLIFIEKSVYADFETYRQNIDLFKNPSDKYNFKFAHVDDIQVFDFIELVKSKPIKTFEKVEEIESYIISQFAGYFYLYLESLRHKSDKDKILDGVTELNNVTLRMNEMVTSLGKHILGTDNREYESVIESQFSIILDYFDEIVRNSIEFKAELSDEEIDSLDLNKVYDTFQKNLFDNPYPITRSLNFDQRVKIKLQFEQESEEAIQLDLLEINENLELEKLNFSKLHAIYLKKIKPHLRNESDIKKFKDRFTGRIVVELGGLPF